MSIVRVRAKLALGILVLFLPLIANTATRPATAEDCAKLAITAPDAPCAPGQTPYDPDARFTGDEVAEATRFLLERNGTGSRDTYCYRSQSDRITRMNPQFRVSLYRALSEIEKQYGGKNIIQSGFRCEGGAHNKGCAADIIWTSCQRNTRGHSSPWRCASDTFDSPEQRWIDQFGKNEPYKIHLPYRSAPEGHHVEPINTSGCVNTPTTRSSSPTDSFASAIRQALGMRQQPALPPQPPIPPQPLPVMQPIVTAFDGQSPPETPDPNPTAPPSTTASSSIADKLADLVKGIERATTTQVATSAPLVINPRDAAHIQSIGAQEPQTGIAGIGGSITQHTFVGDARQWQSANQQVSGFAQILANIAVALRRLLIIVQPFGGAHIHRAEYDY